MPLCFCPREIYMAYYEMKDNLLYILEGFFMKKFISFLNQTSEITNENRLRIIVCTLVLMGIGYWRNYAAYKAEMKNIDLEWELERIKVRLKEKGFSKEEIEDLLKSF